MSETLEILKIDNTKKEKTYGNNIIKKWYGRAFQKDTS